MNESADKESLTTQSEARFEEWAKDYFGMHRYLVSELHIEDCRSAWKKQDAEITKLRGLLDTAMGCLEFYADESSWEPFVLSGSLIDKDHGTEAQDAIKQIDAALKQKEGV